MDVFFIITKPSKEDDGNPVCMRPSQLYAYFCGRVAHIKDCRITAHDDLFFVMAFFRDHKVVLFEQLIILSDSSNSFFWSQVLCG